MSTHYIRKNMILVKGMILVTSKGVIFLIDPFSFLIDFIEFGIEF